MSSGVGQAGLGELITGAITYDRDVNVMLPELKPQVKSCHACPDNADVLPHNSSLRVRMSSC